MVTEVRMVVPSVFFHLRQTLWNAGNVLYLKWWWLQKLYFRYVHFAVCKLYSDTLMHTANAILRGKFTVVNTLLLKILEKGTMYLIP